MGAWGVYVKRVSVAAGLASRCRCLTIDRELSQETIGGDLRITTNALSFSPLSTRSVVEQPRAVAG